MLDSFGYACSQGMEYIERNANEADGEVHDFRCKRTACKKSRVPCSTKTTRTPHACTEYIERTERKSSVVSC